MIPEAPDLSERSDGRTARLELLHVWIADRNAGDRLRDPTDPSDPPGSGKFGTSCERMHVANCNPAACPVAALPLSPLEAPHAASASEKAMAIAWIGGCAAHWSGLRVRCA